MDDTPVDTVTPAWQSFSRSKSVQIHHIGVALDASIVVPVATAAGSGTFQGQDAQRTLDMADERFCEKVRWADGIVVACRGAPLFIDPLHSRRPMAMLAENPRFSSAEDLCRYALESTLGER